MKTPVLIAARNEAATIGRLLETLPADLVDPLVIANDCRDNTTELARSFGATVLVRELPGKLPALQEGVRYLADCGQATGEPILFTDADSWPAFPRHWAQAMIDALPDIGERPSLAVGPLIYRCGAGFASNAVRTVLNHTRQFAALHGHGNQSWRGANMALRLTSIDQVEAYLSMPHYWPGEDHATADMVIALGGASEPTFSPWASVCTESRYASHLIRGLMCSRATRRALSIASYQARCASDAVPYVASSLSLTPISVDSGQLS